jgi:leader peptidase (prepilin peptidase) / N-methyltransferase
MITIVQMAALIAVFGGVFGLLIGSFLNVVVYRVPAGMSVVAPPSACPKCGKHIRGYDNIPVLSWLVLRGKCRDCSAPISSRYPLVEFVTGLLFVVVVLRFMPGATTDTRQLASELVVLVAFLYLMAISVALALIDLDTHKLPNAITYPSYLVLGLLFVGASALSGDWSALLRAVVGAAILGFVYLVLAVAVPGGMGLGDVKLAGVLGLALAYLGWGPLAVGAFGAFFVGGIFAVVLMIAGRAKWRGGIPFGPSMLLGAWIGVLVGTAAWNTYLGTLGLA